MRKGRRSSAAGESAPHDRLWGVPPGSAVYFGPNEFSVYDRLLGVPPGSAVSSLGCSSGIRSIFRPEEGLRI